MTQIASPPGARNTFPRSDVRLGLDARVLDARVESPIMFILYRGQCYVTFVSQPKCRRFPNDHYWVPFACSMLGSFVAGIGRPQNTIFSRTLVLERTRMSEELGGGSIQGTSSAGRAFCQRCTYLTRRQPGCWIPLRPGPRGDLDLTG